MREGRGLHGIMRVTAKAHAFRDLPPIESTSLIAPLDTQSDCAVARNVARRNAESDRRSVSNSARKPDEQPTQVCSVGRIAD